ncbi:histidine triad nucleotide-binding protein [Bradymonadaceae bacterium TMQ3]|nr:histidine triad nucleotide-binding protein [Bradymonadaceae bacterium TMQ3]TXC68637.1 histidine triad nucleotide-binding protein [Bradymonadales bacterium TMQ1]
MSDETIFSKIIRGELPCDKVYETDDVLAFRDINPAAPVHVLVIPKKPIVNVGQADEDDALLLGTLMLAAREVARIEGLEESGFRLVVNNGAEVGQTVFHLHVHVLGGRAFSWPPG